MMNSPRIGSLKNSKAVLLILLWIWFTITSLISTNSSMFVHHADDTWYQWSFVSKVLLMTLVTVVLVDSLERLRLLVLVMAGCFAYFVAKAFPFIIMTGGSFRLYGPEYSMIADNNDFGLALNMTAPLFFFLAQSEEKRWVRGLCGFLFFITIPAVFCTYSRGALTGLIAVIGLMLIKSRQRLLLIPVIGFGLVVALIFAPAAWRQRMDPTRPDAIDGSAKSRLNAWQYSWNLAKDHPVSGGGFGTFTQQLFRIYAPNSQDMHGPHSVYFQVLAEHGFPGLALFLGLIASCFLTLRRITRAANARGDHVVLAYANMFRYSLIGFLTSGVFLGRAYFDYFFSIVACLAALEIASHRAWAHQDEEAEEENEEEEEEELPMGERLLLPKGGVA